MRRYFASVVTVPAALAGNTSRPACPGAPVLKNGCKYATFNPVLSHGSAIELASYKLEGEGWADFCDRPPENRQVAAEAIGTAECTIVFKPDEDAALIGSTPAGGCPSRFRGSEAVTIDARFSRDGLEMWERWYDAAGNQVAGSQTGAYLYRPIDETSP